MQAETRTGLLPLLRSDSAMSAVSVIQADDVVVVLSDFVIGCNQQIPEADGKRWGLVPTWAERLRQIAGGIPATAVNRRVNVD